MAGLTSFIYNTLSTALFGVAMDETTNSPYQPSIEDVFAVKDIFFKKCRLPLEIIDVVIDFAEYWPHTSTIRTGGELKVAAGRPLYEDQFILRTYPLGYVPKEDNPTSCTMSDTDQFPIIAPRPWTLPENFPTEATHEVKDHFMKVSRIRGEYPCRKIVFTLKSHDQGWGGQRQDRGTYKGSFTWFEVGQERLVVLKNTQKMPSTLERKPKGDTTPEEALETGKEGRWPEFSEHFNLSLLPHFSFSLKENRDTQGFDTSTTCTLRTLSPKIETRVTAHDPPQSETWFSHALLPSKDCLQKNITASKESQTNVIEWRYDDDINPESLDANALLAQGRGPASKTGEYVRGLKLGDAVTVWGKARFPLWVNTVEQVKIEVFWAV